MFPFQGCSQSFKRTLEAGSHRSRGQAHHAADLRGPVVEEVPEDDDRPIAWVELNERGHELGRQRLRAIGRGDIELRLQANDSLATGPGPKCVQRLVHDDPMEPGMEMAAAVEALHRAQGREQCLLSNLLGLGRVVDDQVCGPIGDWPVAADDGFGRFARSSRGFAKLSSLPGWCQALGWQSRRGRLERCLVCPGTPHITYTVGGRKASQGRDGLSAHEHSI